MEVAVIGASHPRFHERGLYSNGGEGGLRWGWRVMKRQCAGMLRAALISK